MKLAPKKYNREEQLKKCNKDLRKRINKTIYLLKQNISNDSIDLRLKAIRILEGIDRYEY